MPRANPALLASNSGEFSGALAARMDFSKYQFGAAIMRNFLPLIEGGMTKRPGSRYVASLADQSSKGRLMPFIFSTTQAYMLLLEDRQIRFFRNQGQITVVNTDAAITNGTFDSDITGWDDNSSGSASAEWRLINGIDEGLWAFPNTAQNNWGDADHVNGKNSGLKFTASVNSTVIRVRLKTGTTHTASANARAYIYTDNSGSPGTQVGGASDDTNINAASTEFSFTWSSNAPTLAQGTTYWAVVESDSTMDTSIECCADQGPNYASGSHDTITSITDKSGLVPGDAQDLRFEVLVDDGNNTNGALALVGSSGDTASAEQDVATTNTGQEHVIRFRVIGAPGDEIDFKVGSTSGGEDILSAKVGVGWHTIAFTPEISPFYVQFENTKAKTIYVDDVELIDNAALELTTPYATADLFQVKHTQSADVMYLTHPDYPVYKLSRTGHTSWSLTEVLFEDGPWLDPNDTATTLDPGATTGLGITFTFSSTEGVNGGAGLSRDDVGRLVRYSSNGTAWGWAVITEVVNQTEFKADIKSTFAAHTAQATWRLGAWSKTTGYPSCSTFFEQRLVLGGSTDQPQTLWFSQSADIENMTPDNRDDDNDGSVEDDDALDFTLAANEVNAIRWLAGGQYLFLGTSGGEWMVRSSGAFITPTDIDVKQHTTHGSANVQPVRVGRVVLYPQVQTRKIRELVFDDLAQGLRSPDLTILAPHVVGDGFEQIAFQEEPHRILWCVRSDGQLAALTYEREENVVGWSRHILGGAFSSGNAVVESVAVIPGNDGQGQTYGSGGRDEVWLIVKRTVDGNTVRYVEFLEGMYEGPLRDDYASDSAYQTALIADQKNAFYVDSGLTYSGSSTGTISGLTHLEGQTVAVWGDGVYLGTFTVSSGQITLGTNVTFAHVGLPYESTWKSLKNTAGAARGSPMGQRSRIHKVTAVFKETLAGKIGPQQGTTHTLVFPDALTGSTKPLFTGELEIDDFDGDWESDPRIYFTDTAPAPITVLAWQPRVSVNEL